MKSSLVRIGAMIGLILSNSPALADQLFHTERLPLRLTEAGAAAGHPELRSGHVVDIHPNGPVNGALERYMINGAKPNHDYTVFLRLFVGDCDGLGPIDLPTVVLGTNKRGNAHGKITFPVETVLPEPIFFGIFWELVDEEGVAAYDTDCIQVGLDTL